MVRYQRNIGGSGVDKRPYIEPPFLLGDELRGKTYKCKFCGDLNLINWYEKQGAPKESIQGTTEAGGYWVPVSFRNVCNGCKQANDIVAPDSPVQKRLHLFGDEAERTFIRDGKRYCYFCIALVAVSPDYMTTVTKRVEKIEGNIRSASNGVLSHFHAKEIMDKKKWSAQTGLGIRLNFIRRLCQAVANKRVTKFVVAGAGEWQSEADQKYLRDQVFSALFLYTLDRTRSQGIVPIFHFDQVKSGKKNGWAEECVRGLRYYPPFVWFSRRAHIADPEFVKPGGFVQNKIANALAFVTAREFEKSVNGEKADIATSEFGDTLFAGYNGRGDLIFAHKKGFPLEKTFLH